MIDELDKQPDAAESGDETVAPESGEAAPQSDVEAEQDSDAAAEEAAAESVAAEADQVDEEDAGEPVAEPVAAKSASAPRGPIEDLSGEVADEEEEAGGRDWYILKVQSNREDSIRDALMRRVKIMGLEGYFGDIIVPTERVTEFTKSGRKRTVKRKLYPGDIVVNMEINDETWFLVRETPGIGDFTGSGGRPVPLEPKEVKRILSTEEDKPDAPAKLKINFKPGGKVKIKEGTFENFEGEVEHIDETNGRITVMIAIFGRSTPVELEYWQAEAI